MQRYAPESPVASGIPNAAQALEQAGDFVRQLMPFPSSGAVGPLSLLPVLPLGAAPQSGAADSAAAAAAEAVAASIVSQAASILDEEMARGVLDARTADRAAPAGRFGAADPVLRQMYELVDNYAAQWPQLQRGVRGAAASEGGAGEAGPLPQLRPHATVKPGERTTVSMTLRNNETRSVRVVPMVTDLLGDRGGRIPRALVEISPAEMALDPQEQKTLTIAVAVPVDAPTGSYSGLLVARGLDYLRAMVTIDVAAESGTPARPQPASSSGIAVPAPAPALALAGPAVGYSRLAQEAARLAEDGELGNSDAIHLLQMPHSARDIEEVLARFDKQLTCEAKSKLILDARVPLPSGVKNQRWEPIFDRYPLSGRMYTTRNGAVVPNEVQYYNGEMVQLYGGCSNVTAVREALAGSGYQPMTMKSADGRESAIAHLWAHQLSDTSLGPYNAMFLIVVAVPDGSTGGCIRADDNGASSALSMLDGCFDPVSRIYENKVHLFFVRMLDSTTVAIDVGRERMGTDKRPGEIDLDRDGTQRTFSIRASVRDEKRPVARIRFVPAKDPSAYLPALAKAAATASLSLPGHACGTEYVYPAAARIGNGPVVRWQWRTETVARFQPVEPDMVVLDGRSDEGAILIRWGFEPQVLGFLPNVRGVATGISEAAAA